MQGTIQVLCFTFTFIEAVVLDVLSVVAGSLFVDTVVL